MKRRTFLAGASATITVSGCLSTADTQSTPERPSFESASESDWWDHPLEGGPVRLATATDLFVGTETTLARITPDGTEVWSVETETGAVPLAVSGTTVYTNGSSRETDRPLVAYDAETGKSRWTQSHGISAPAVIGTTEDAVFIGSTFEEGRRDGWPAFAFEAESGSQRWQAETGTVARATVSHDRCLVRSLDQLTALDTATGETAWQRTPGQSDFAPMHITGDTALVCSDDAIQAYTLPSGTEEWTMSLAQGKSIAVTATDTQTTDTAFIGTYDGAVVAFDVRSGEEDWRVTRSGSVSGGAQVVHRRGTVTAQVGEFLYGFDAADGTELWAQPLTPIYNLAGPVVINNTVFLLRAPTNGEVFVETYDLSSGEARWRHQLDSTHFGFWQSLGDYFLVAAENGPLYGFHAT
jgi:outer membrane protein assembly factor BamB